VNHLKWPGFILASLLVVFAMACSSDSGPDSSSGTTSSAHSTTEPAAAANQPAVTPEPGASAFSVTIKHKFGSTAIEAEPERVVSLGYTEQDPLLALGVTPVAVREWFGEQPYAVWPWAQDELADGKPQVLQMPYGELDFEALAALNPDVFSATHSGITQEEYDTLSQMAPVVAQPDTYPDFGTPWQEQTLIIGRALGLADKAGEVVADVEGQIQAASAAHPELAGKTVAWGSPAEDGTYYVVGPNTPPMRFLTALGLALPDDLATVVGDLDSASISTEQLSLLDVDVLIFQTDSEEARDAILANPVFQQLDVVKEGRVIFFAGLTDPIYGALSFSTVLSLPLAVEQLVPRLANAVAQ
jgi:iron complex transport system substrate-binding protein